VYKNLYSIIKNSKGFSTNSQTIKLGECFFALKGSSFDASCFVQEALSSGAKYVITENLQILNHEDKVLYVTSTQDALAYCSKNFYADLPKYKIAVTGTNGKTSTADYCRQIFELCGLKAASIGTIGICSSTNISQDLHALANLTSNDLISNYKILSGLKKSGINHISLEVSSIGLDQNRFDQMEFNAAGFVSFALDHLDYHKSTENYLKAKLKLFSDNFKTNTANVFITLDVMHQLIKYELPNKLKNYKLIGYTPHCNVYIKSVSSSLDGQQVIFVYEGLEFNFSTPIIGKFQIENLIFAILLTHQCGLELEKILQIADKLQPVKGRLQKVSDPKKNRYIFIDYAHNPDALKKVLLELNLLKNPNSKLFTIFGCGGDRDKSKRPTMGCLASQLSDQVVITDDNPRNEVPELIRQEIISGMNKNNYLEIANRHEAIKYVLDKMSDCDILLVAGKGHEEYQIYKDQKHFFSDFKTIEFLLT
jgi:UDP-N-acetylmuramoyl-L-alanyl-D-glutamate--2,6-diaminopimelate ligase